MKLAIIGSRTFNDYDVLTIWADAAFYMFDNDDRVIISGGAKGADSLGKKFAQENKIEYLEFPADWDKHGKSAGFVRNQQIVDNCDMILAFWDGKSKGTKDTIDKARKAKKPTFIIYF